MPVARARWHRAQLCHVLLVAPLMTNRFTVLGHETWELHVGRTRNLARELVILLWLGPANVALQRTAKTRVKIAIRRAKEARRVFWRKTRAHAEDCYSKPSAQGSALGTFRSSKANRDDCGLGHVQHRAITELHPFYLGSGGGVRFPGGFRACEPARLFDGERLHGCLASQSRHFERGLEVGVEALVHEHDRDLAVRALAQPTRQRLLIALALQQTANQRLGHHTESPVRRPPKVEALHVTLEREQAIVAQALVASVVERPKVCDLNRRLGQVPQVISHEQAVFVLQNLSARVLVDGVPLAQPNLVLLALDA